MTRKLRRDYYFVKMDDPVPIIFDLEFVQPKLDKISGAINKEGIFERDEYQTYSSRIWQMAFICGQEKIFKYVHPGIPVEELSPSSKKFLRDKDLKTIEGLHQVHNLKNVWRDICEWLVRVAPSKRIVLIAQQAQHSDEIVLSVEMARQNISWPPGFTVYAIDALPTIQEIYTEQFGEYKRCWNVSALYKDFTGQINHLPHNALADAECLLTNLKCCWWLRLMTNMGFLCPPENMQLVSVNLNQIDNLFWKFMHETFQWSIEYFRDIRESIWALARPSNKNNAPWPREVIHTLEKHNVFTNSDLVKHSADFGLLETLRKDPVCNSHLELISTEIDNRISQLKNHMRKENIEMSVFLIEAGYSSLQ